MKFPGFMKGKEIRPTWRYHASGIIWRVVPTGSGKLVGEDRDVDRKQATFFCVSQTSGEVLWQGVEFSERWWIGIEAIHRDVVLLHGFAKPDMPEHKGVFAVDLLTGTKLWSNDECKFLVAEDDVVLAAKDSLEGNIILELEYRTGAILRSWGNNSQVVRDARNRISSRPSDAMEFPVPLGRIDNGESEAADLVRSYCTNKSIVGLVEVLDNEDTIVVNYHERMGQGEDTALHLKNTIAVLERESGSVLLHETINEDVQAIAPESFFVQHGTLFYIKNRNTLTAVSLAVSERN
ncbi:MAG TPA: DUF4905 domain-containing protein [Bacteroidota bacterium]|jgi:hypothetical protein|nr:DUF4905 domain-containing protein [Bacteroidota bacterium]